MRTHGLHVRVQQDYERGTSPMSERDALRAMYSEAHAASLLQTARCRPGSRQYTLLLVADQDEGAANQSTGDLQSTLRRGVLCESTDDHHSTDPSFSVVWADSVTLNSRLSLAGRGMELSTLTWFGDRLLSCDDRTGIIFEIRGGSAQPRHILTSTTPGGQFKCEWAAVRRGLLYIGGIGRPFRIPVDPNNPAAGYKVGGNDMVVSIDTAGTISYHNFSAVYGELCRAAGCGPNGYLTHEAAAWIEGSKGGDGMWIFAPRRFSVEPFDEVMDEMRGGHSILRYIVPGGHDGALDGGGNGAGRASAVRFASDRSDSSMSTGGPDGFDPRGISSIRQLPGSTEILVALKTEEVGGRVASYLSVMRSNGQILLPDVLVAEGFKFEGLELSSAMLVP